MKVCLEKLAKGYESTLANHGTFYILMRETTKINCSHKAFMKKKLNLTNAHQDYLKPFRFADDYLVFLEAENL